MARKFQIGDIVEVVKPTGGAPFENDFKTKHRGVIIGYDKTDEYPYDAERKNGVTSLFKPRELKLIKRKGKVT